MSVSAALRKGLAWTHLWLGLIGGLFVCLLGATGAIVTFRPQMASLMGPPAIPVTECRQTTDWNQAQRQIETSAHSTIDRIYFPDGSDPRYHFRMRTDVDAIYTHVIYDACAGQVLGVANLQWMDWLVDLHHNLLAGRTGRQFAGAIGIVLFLSGAGGLALLLSRPNLKRIFRVQLGGNIRRTMFDLHRSVGLGAVGLLLLQAFTGVWLCYPQALRAVLTQISPVPSDLRPAPGTGAEGDRSPAGLGDLIGASQRAIPDGTIREIRMPGGRGNVQVRMRRAGDFRSLGNNVVSLDRFNAEVLGTDLYSAKPASSRFIEAMAGLHYAEWGGMVFRVSYGAAGMTTVPLFFTGGLYWWLRKRRSVPDTRRISVADLDHNTSIANRV